MHLDFSESREESLVLLLMRYPATLEMILKASKRWDHPLKSLSSTKDLVYRIQKEDCIGSIELTGRGRGQKPRLYHLKPKAEKYCEALRPFSACAHRSNHCFFRPFRGRNVYEHDLALHLCCAELERSMGETNGRVRLIHFRRDGYLRFPVHLKNGKKKELVPDGTYVLSVDGNPQLYFIEAEHKTSQVIPVTTKSPEDTFQYKLTRYKALAHSLRRHPFIREQERVNRTQFTDFKVLIYSVLRGPEHINHLMAANYSNYETVVRRFCFTRLTDALQMNAFTDPLWRLSNGKTTQLLQG